MVRSLPPFPSSPKDFYPPLLSSIPGCTEATIQLISAEREDALTTLKLAEAVEAAVFPPSPPPLAPMKYFSARRARPIKFRAAASRNNSRGSTRLPPFFRNLSPSPPPPFFGNVFKAPRAANRKRLCLARVTARPSLALDLSS